MKGKHLVSTKTLLVLLVILVSVTVFIWKLDDAIQEQAEISTPAEENNEEEVRRIEAEIIAREIAEEKEALKEESAGLKEVEKILNEPVKEEVCNPSIEVTKTYKFTSAIGFTFAINNDCNENLSPGRIKFALHNPNGSVYAKKLIDFPVLKPYTHWSTEIVFKTGVDPDFVTYSLQRK